MSIVWPDRVAMKPPLIDELKKEHEAVHGCFRPEDGPCFYIASDAAAADYGRRQGRRFVAALEDRGGTLREILSLTFLVGTMAQRVRADMIGNLDEFCREVGLERLREALERDCKTERDEEIVLTNESDEAKFQRPDPARAIRRYQALKTKVVQLLAGYHAQGSKRVSASVLLEGLCDDPRLTTRALNDLVELNLIRDLNHTDGMRLTAYGQKLAEETISLQPTRPVPSVLANPERFDFFISYASEDRGIAEALENCLNARGFTVWRDRSQLTLGDSLTLKINEGLAACRFGIVILSEAFLRKNWPQAELNALQARAIAEGQKVILPVRRSLTHEQMAKHLPLLGDKLTIGVDGNLEEVAGEIERAARS